MTAPSFADSAQRRLGRHYNPRVWNEQVAAARREFRDFYLPQSVVRPLRGRIRLVNAQGDKLQLNEAGPVTVVVLWSRNCPRAVNELATLQQLAPRIVAAGARILLMTPDARTPQLDAFFAERKLGIPVYYDTQNDSRWALDEWGFPYYLVLDRRGRVRFRNHSATDDIVREVHALSDGSARTAEAP